MASIITSITVFQNFELCFFCSFYTATACYGNNAAQFPSSNLFASAGEGIWDNGAACGRQYLVRCISAAHPRTCIPGQTIQIRIVDRALSSVSRPSRDGATMVLSKTAFGMISKPTAPVINIEFQQWVSILLSFFISTFHHYPFNFSFGLYGFQFFSCSYFISSPISNLSFPFP